VRTHKLATFDAVDIGEAVASAGNLRVDTSTFRVFVGDEAVLLTYQEFDLLRVLFANRDRIVSYDELIEAIWPGERDGTRKQLGVAVCRLRARIAGSHPYRIETVRGRGYGLTQRRQG
jgi:DNA-binding response OmpR family regulator